MIAAALLLSGALASAAQVTINPVKDNTIYQGTDPVSEEVFEGNSCGAGLEGYAGNTNDGIHFLQERFWPRTTASVGKPFAAKAAPTMAACCCAALFSCSPDEASFLN